MFGKLVLDESLIVVSLYSIIPEKELNLFFLFKFLNEARYTAMCSSFFFFSYRFRMRLPIANLLNFSISRIYSFLASLAIIFSRYRA